MSSLSYLKKVINEFIDIFFFFLNSSNKLNFFYLFTFTFLIKLSKIFKLSLLYSVSNSFLNENFELKNIFLINSEKYLDFINSNNYRIRDMDLN